MKNILKYVNLFIFTVILTLTLPEIAKAAPCDGYSSTYCRRGSIHDELIADKDLEDTTKDGTKITREPSNKPHTKYTDLGILKYANNVESSESTFLVYNAEPISGRYYTSLYCIDPQLDSVGYDLYIQRFLYDETIGTDRQNAYDIAVLSVMTNSGQNNGIITHVYSYYQKSDGNVADYLARLLAIRSLTYIFGFENNRTFDNSAVAHYEYEQAHKWVAEQWLNANSKSFEELNSLIKKAGWKGLVYPTQSGGQYFKNNTNATGWNEINAKGQAYFEQGLKDAIDFMKNFSTIEGVSKKSTNTVEVTSSQSGTVTKDITISMTVGGLAKNSGEEFVINGFQYSGNKPNGVTGDITSVKINGTEQGKSILGTNLLNNFDFSNQTTIDITIRFTGSRSNFRCSEMPFKFYIDGYYTYSGFSKFNKYVGYVLYNYKENNQRFVGIEENKEPSKTYLLENILGEFSMALIDSCTCNDIAQDCLSAGSLSSPVCQELVANTACSCYTLDVTCQIGTNDECNKAKQDYSTVCQASCVSLMEGDPVCCDDQNNLIISQIDNKPVNIYGVAQGSEKACFVDKIDAEVKATDDGNGNTTNEVIGGVSDQNGNSFTLESMKSNKYCTISCRESYSMSLPNAKLSTAGRYLTFTARVFGLKSCYTNTINKTQYEKDIEAAQAELVSTYNNWIRYKLAMDNVNGSAKPQRSTSYCNSTCGGTYDTYSINYQPGNYGYSYSNGVLRSGISLQAVTLTSNNQYQGSSACDTSTRYCSACNTANGYSLVCPDGSNTCDRTEKICQKVACNSGYNLVCPDGSNTCDKKDKVCQKTICRANDNNCIVNPNVTQGMCTSTSCGSYYCSSPCRSGTAQNVIDQLSSALASAKSAFDSALAEYNKIINDYKDCSGNWPGSTINYDPDVTFDYDESYMNLLTPRIGYMVETSQKSDSIDWYFDGPVNDNYDGCGKNTSNTEEKQYVYCTSGSNPGCSLQKYTVPKNQYKKSETTIDVTYKPKSLFYNNYTDGSITTSPGNNSVLLENKLPIRRDTTGDHRFSIIIDNLGEYYSSEKNHRAGTLGRYFGGDNAVFDKDAFVYDCVYLVNVVAETLKQPLVCDFDKTCTDDCISNCVGPHCSADDCNGPDCISNCVGVGCMYDDTSGSGFYERIVSLNNLFPNDAANSIPYNWSNEKGALTKKLIEEDSVSATDSKNPLKQQLTGDGANSIYNTTPILSVTINANAKAKISNYNDQEENNGGYSNNTMNCYSLNGYQRIACYSTFINDLLDGKFGDIVNKNSLIVGNNYRKEGNNNTQYFTTWTGTISEYDMLGPSWK